MQILHFADAHIDIANHGQLDPDSGLPVRVMDFLSSLDRIIDSALELEVDLVIFAGDAYKDRNPQPTFQQAWGKRMMRLSEAGIQTLLLLGNHDVTPAAGRANTLQEFATLKVPKILVADAIALIGPEQLGIPLQIITVPWISRGQLLSRQEIIGKPIQEVLKLIEKRVENQIDALARLADPSLPLVLTAHASVKGAHFGGERSVMLGSELTLDPSVISDERFDYVALGHVHKHQSLSAVIGANHPPVVYSGSIERVDFGEYAEEKGFVLVELMKGKTEWQFIPLPTRNFIDIKCRPQSADSMMKDILDDLPSGDKVKDAICRLEITYPRKWEPLIDERSISDRFKSALSFKVVKHRLEQDRVRLKGDSSIESLGPYELLAEFWKTVGVGDSEQTALLKLAESILSQVVI